MSQIFDPQQKQKQKSKQKKSNLRDIINIKALMDKRKEQRASTIYNLANTKFQNALIIARQLLFTSQKIWKEYHDQYSEEFQENLFFRTSKNKEQTEYLLDSVIICKVFIKCKKRDDILEVIQKIQIPDIKVIPKSDLTTKQAIFRYNEMKQIMARTCAALLSFIQITKQQKLNQSSQKLYKEYIQFIKTYYGPLQYATATFIYANYLYENQQYKKALEMHEICLSIRKQNCLNEAFVDVLVNSAICMREIGQIKLAIERMKFAIQVSKDLKKSQEGLLDQYHLFLAKLELEDANFPDAYKNYQIAYKLRENLDSQDPRKVQIQLNLLYFYKMLQKTLASQSLQQCFNIKDRKDIETRKKQAYQTIKDMTKNIFNREQFTKYDDFNKKMAHLNLIVTQPFFDLLSADQVIELNNLLQKLGSCSFQKGVSQLFKCTFFEEKKIRELLLAANPLITSTPRTVHHI